MGPKITVFPTKMNIYSNKFFTKGKVSKGYQRLLKVNIQSVLK